jgi:hypothetical protein
VAKHVLPKHRTRVRFSHPALKREYGVPEALEPVLAGARVCRARGRLPHDVYLALTGLPHPVAHADGGLEPALGPQGLHRARDARVLHLHGGKLALRRGVRRRGVAELLIHAPRGLRRAEGKESHDAEHPKARRHP